MGEENYKYVETEKDKILKHMNEGHKNKQLLHYDDGKYIYTSGFNNDNKLVFIKTDIKTGVFCGYCDQIIDISETNSGTKKTKLVYKPMKPYKETQNKRDSNVIAFLASKNKGDREEATELLVLHFKSKNRIYTTRNDDKSEIWIYREGIYIPEGRTYIQEFCRFMLEKLYTTNICNQVVSKIEADTFINQDDFFTNPNIELIPLQNGILNIKTKELKDFDPDIIFFNKLNINYDPNIKNDVFEEFFKDILHEKDVPVMQELFGYILYRDYPIHKSFMLNGVGRNGKGTTLNLIEKFINIKNITDLTLKDMEEDNFTLCRLHNKMVNSSGDIDDSYIQQSGTFKKLTGNDTLSAKRKFKTDINFKNYAKMIFACNDLPIFKDDSEGQWSRWVLLDFPYRFKTKDEYDSYSNIDKVKLKLKVMDINKVENLTTEENMTALLNWALEGLDRLLNKSAFSSGTAENVRKNWKMKNNSVLLFVNTFCFVEFGELITMSEFKQEYGKFCQINRIKTESSKIINQTLEKEFGVFQHRKTDGVYYEGVTLKKYKNNQKQLKQ